MTTNQGAAILKPSVAEPGVSDTDVLALANVGVVDIVSRSSSRIGVCVSQLGFDLISERAAGHLGKESNERVLARYRSRRRVLASRSAQVARLVVLIGGTVLVIWIALTGSWMFVAIGVLGATFGIPVTRLAEIIHDRLTEKIDAVLLRFFEGR